MSAVLSSDVPSFRRLTRLRPHLTGCDRCDARSHFGSTLVTMLQNLQNTALDLLQASVKRTKPVISNLSSGISFFRGPPRAHFQAHRSDVQSDGRRPSLAAAIYFSQCMRPDLSRSPSELAHYFLVACWPVASCWKSRTVANNLVLHHPTVDIVLKAAVGGSRLRLFRLEEFHFNHLPRCAGPSKMDSIALAWSIGALFDFSNSTRLAVQGLRPSILRSLLRVFVRTGPRQSQRP